MLRDSERFDTALERARAGLEAGRLVQCEYCGAIVPLDDAHPVREPGATLTFCGECYND